MLRATKVAGLYHAKLDVYFPIALFSRAPHYFSKRAPYRIVAAAALGDGEEQRGDNERNEMSGSNLESMLRQLFLTDTGRQQADSGATRTLVRLTRHVEATCGQESWLKCGQGRFEIIFPGAVLCCVAPHKFL